MAHYNSYAKTEVKRGSDGKYWWRGKIYISVSTVLGVEGGNLVPWALWKFGKEPDAKEAYTKWMNWVSGLGTNIHKYIESDLQGQPMDESLIWEDSRLAIASYHKWKENNEIKAVGVEVGCASEKWRIAGTCDFVGYINGKPYVGDTKTGSVQDKAFTQMAAYKSFMLEMKGSPDYPLPEDFPLDKAELVVFNVHRDGLPVKVVTMDDQFKGGQGMTEEVQLGIFHALRYIWGMRNLNSTKWKAVIKNIDELISPMVEEFKETFKL